jgi:hypothetical protein
MQANNPATYPGAGVFNIATGSVVSGSGAAIEVVGDGWYRISIAGVSEQTAGTFFNFSLSANGTDFSYTGDGTSGIYIFGAQLSDSASVDPYVYQPVAAPASTAYYGPRFDYDPVTLAPKGLLIEEQRTQLLLRSEEFDNATWVKGSGTSVTANATVAPDGTSTADALSDSAISSQFQTNQSAQYLVAGQAYAFSVYAKANGRDRIVLSVYGGAAGRYFTAVFNLATVSVTLTNAGAAGTYIGSSIQDAGNGWYRCSLIGSVAAVGTNQTFIWLTDTDSPTINIAGQPNLYLGNGTGVYLWGGQVEQGAFSTSYIPTVASQVTRAADNASMIGNNFARWYTQGDGTIYQQFTALGISANDRFSVLLSVDTVPSTNAIHLRNFNGTNVAQVWQNSVNQVSSTVTPSVVAGAVNKLAFALKTDNFAASKNGNTAVTDTSGGLPVGLLRLDFPASGCNTIARFAYYNRRLADSELQGITA